MNFKFSVLLVVVALLILETDAWGRRRRRRYGSRRRSWVRKASKALGHVNKYGHHAVKWAGHASKFLGGVSWDELKKLRQDNEDEFKARMDELHEELSEQADDDVATFVIETFDHVTSEAPEPVSDEKQELMEQFLKALEDASYENDFEDDDFEE